MVTSVTRPGNGGFYVLFYEDKRIAYLQCREGLKASVYELWNEEVWVSFMRDKEPLEALQHALNLGKVSLKKLIKSPSGRMIDREFDLTGTVIRTDPDNDGVATINSRHMSKKIWFDSPRAIELPGGRKMLATVPQHPLGVVVANRDRAAIIIDELGLSNTATMILVTTNESLGRGMRLSGLLVDEDSWPLTDSQYESLAPCLVGAGSIFKIERVVHSWLSSKDSESVASV